MLEDTLGLLESVGGHKCWGTGFPTLCTLAALNIRISRGKKLISSFISLASGMIWSCECVCVCLGEEMSGDNQPFLKFTKAIYLVPLNWRQKWQPTPVLLPGKSHGRRSLVGCSPWGREEPDTTE